MQEGRQKLWKWAISPPQVEGILKEGYDHPQKTLSSKIDDTERMMERKAGTDMVDVVFLIATGANDFGLVQNL